MISWRKLNNTIKFQAYKASEQDKSGGFGLALNGQGVQVKQVFEGGKERLDTGAALLAPSLACIRSQISCTVTTCLRGGWPDRFSQRSQHGHSALGARINQIAVIVARVEQQGFNRRRQHSDPVFQDMTLTSTAGHGGVQHHADGRRRHTRRDMGFVAVDPPMIGRLNPIGFPIQPTQAFRTRRRKRRTVTRRRTAAERRFLRILSKNLVNDSHH